MDPAEEQHLAWLARSFGRKDYLPLTVDDLEALSGAGSLIDKHAGTHLFREGSDSDAAFVIRSGDAELFRSRGPDRLVVGRVGPGAVIGDISMLRSQPYVSSARTLTRVRAFRIDRARLLPILLEHPMIAIRWLVAGLDQLEATQRRVLRLMRGTVKEQVAGMVLDESDRYGELRLSQASLAELLGVSRQSVNLALSELRSVGAVDTGYRSVSMVDRRGLAAAAGR